MSYLYISHDPAVVRAMSDHTVVMKDGKFVEQGETGAIFDRRAEPYTAS